MIIVDATKSRASDIHIEPREKYVQIRYRIDGGLRDISKFSTKILGAVISRVKIISDLDIIKGITQVSVNNSINYTFATATALRSILRQVRI